jgi:hypothetical protein
MAMSEAIQNSSTTSTTTTRDPKNEVHILITQCLQNSFLRADDNRLVLPREVVARMLVPKPETKTGNPNPNNNRREFNDENLQEGALGRILGALAEREPQETPLHVMHIRDWHTPSPAYDDERKRYGIHCEAGTWDAEYIFTRTQDPQQTEPIHNETNIAFQKYFKPWDPEGKGANPEGEIQAQSLKGYPHNKKRNGQGVIYYDIRSDSVFDFKAPQSKELQDARDKAFAKDKELVGDNPPDTILEAILNRIIKEERAKNDKLRVYVVIIGVYTDIKIKTLLMGLRSRYLIENLVVSDVLTASPTLERHLEALDFIDKVMNVEIIHSLEELVHTLEPSSSDTFPNALLEGQVDFTDYRTYFRDKQQILMYQDVHLIRYSELTGKRSLENYEFVNKTNQRLVGWGFMLLRITVGLTFFAIFMHMLGVEVPWWLLVIPGGLSVAQLLTSFILIPQLQIRNNLQELVRLRNYLETYSTISGLLRFFMTKANSLHIPENDKERELAEKELNLLEHRINIIMNAARQLASVFGTTTEADKIVTRMSQKDDTTPQSTIAPINNNQSDIAG